MFIVQQKINITTMIWLGPRQMNSHIKYIKLMLLTHIVSILVQYQGGKINHPLTDQINSIIEIRHQVLRTIIHIKNFMMSVVIVKRIKKIRYNDNIINYRWDNLYTNQNGNIGTKWGYQSQHLKKSTINNYCLK